MKEARVWLGPDRPDVIAAAIEDAGGRLVAAPDEANAVVWSQRGYEPEGIQDVLHDAIEWVQLESAGVEDWIQRGLVDRARVWTGAQGVYAPDVAEHVLAFLLAATRRLPQAARRTSWGPLSGDRLAGKAVAIVGAGGIGREVITRLRPFRARALALTRSGRTVEGADESLGPERLDELLERSDYVVLSVPLTPETRGMISERELALMPSHAWLVNVGRGALVDACALVAALEQGRIGGACLDVTDPEPLPDGHPLWGFENVLITPHVANPWEVHFEPLAERVAENVRRFRDGRDLLGVVDLDRSY
ncbi:MAG: D-isomer specific 2-hydroxyacid dehydrogenase family protein [Actinomycetota bacterium]|nr:D-isomer specific 2-hydroxyacid dehydrogenase family protein [Actinomycetota bacterium]